VDGLVGGAIRSSRLRGRQHSLVSVFRLHLLSICDDYLGSYLGVFVGILLVTLTVQTSALVAFVFGIIRAAKRIHKLLIDAVLGTTLRQATSLEAAREPLILILHTGGWTPLLRLE